MENQSHPLPSGTIIPSLGGHFTYRVVGPCCRLFDREQLPWPCCRIQWRGKEPSWRRIGRRFTPDLAAKKAPSYSVEVLEPGCTEEKIILTIYSDRLSQEQRDWWYSRRRSAAIEPPRHDQVQAPSNHTTAKDSAVQTRHASPTSQLPTSQLKENSQDFSLDPTGTNQKSAASERQESHPPSDVIQGVLPF